MHHVDNEIPQNMENGMNKYSQLSGKLSASEDALLKEYWEGCDDECDRLKNYRNGVLTRLAEHRVPDGFQYMSGWDCVKMIKQTLLHENILRVWTVTCAHSTLKTCRIWTMVGE